MNRENRRKRKQSLTMKVGGLYARSAVCLSIIDKRNAKFADKNLIGTVRSNEM